MKFYNFKKPRSKYHIFQTQSYFPNIISSKYHIFQISYLYTTLKTRILDILLLKFLTCKFSSTNFNILILILFTSNLINYAISKERNISRSTKIQGYKFIPYYPHKHSKTVSKPVRSPLLLISSN